MNAPEQPRRSDRPPPAEVPGEGEVIGGKYVVERVLGIGGMGAVVAARHLQLGQRVALKFLLSDAARQADAAQRFLREGRAAAAIENDHIARVSDFGTLPNGAPYLVMEYLTGADLGEVLRRGGPLSQGRATDFIMQACEALAEAHARGIVHRDLKPGNLFLAARSDGTEILKVIDFGISKLIASEERLTASAAIMGSPHYMSPEQLKSAKNVDARTDVWALGVILFELLAGAPPFDGDSLAGVVASIVTDPTPSIRVRRPDLVPEIDLVIQRALSKNPAQRFASVGELAEALAPLSPPSSGVSLLRIRRLGSQPVYAATALTPAFSSAPPPPPPAPQVEPPNWASTKRSAVSASSGAVLLLGVAIAAAGIAVAIYSTMAARSIASAASGSSVEATAAPAPSAPPPATTAIASASAPAPIDVDALPSVAADANTAHPRASSPARPGLLVGRARPAATANAAPTPPAAKRPNPMAEP